MPARPHHCTVGARTLPLLLALLLAPAPIVAWAPPAGAAEGVAPTAAHATATTEELAFYGLINEARAAHGLGVVQYDPALSAAAADWAAVMAGTGVLAHDPDLVANIDAAVGPNWTHYGGNVGMGGDVAGLHAASMASPTHAANVLGPYDRVGVGVVWSGSTLWLSIIFLGGGSPA